MNTKVGRIFGNTLFSKIFLSTIPVLLVGAAVTFGVYQFYFGLITSAFDTQAAAGELKSLVLDVEREELSFLLDDLTSPTFYRTARSQHFDQARLLFEKAIASADQLNKNLQNQKLKLSVSSLRSDIAEQRQLLEKIAERYRQRGFGAYGEESIWEADFQDLKHDLIISGRSDLAYRLEDIRSNALEYMYQDDRTKAEIVDSELKEFEKFGRVKPVESIRKSFRRYSQFESEIGLSQNEGLREKVKDGLTKLTRVADSIMQTAKEAQAQQRQRFGIVTSLLLLAIVLLKTLIIRSVASSIAKPLEILRKSMRLAEEGHRSLDVRIESGDELESLALAFRRLLKNLDASEQNLIQSQKLEAMGTLAGGLAHDFNNLLASMYAYVSILKSRLACDTLSARDLAAIESCIQRGTQLIKQILDFSRPTALKQEAIDIKRIFEEVVLLTKPSLPKSTEISISIDEGADYVTADSGQLVQALLNLIFNARDAMPEGGLIRLRAELVSENLKTNDDFDKHMNYCKISVSDTGSGIAPEHIARIFDPFFTTKPVGKGTGLGLASVHSIVERHGGKIAVTSNVGVGTTFDLFFGTPVELNPSSASTLLLSGEIIFILSNQGSSKLIEVLEANGASVFEETELKTALSFVDANRGLLSIVLIAPREHEDETATLLKCVGDAPAIVLTAAQTSDQEQLAALTELIFERMRARRLRCAS